MFVDYYELSKRPQAAKFRNNSESVASGRKVKESCDCVGFRQPFGVRPRCSRAAIDDDELGYGREVWEDW